MYVSDNFCYHSFLLWSIFSLLGYIQLKRLNPLRWAYLWLIYFELTDSKICGGKTMAICKLWIKRCKLGPTITVLSTRNFAYKIVCAKPFYMHENQCKQTLNLSSPVIKNNIKWIYVVLNAQSLQTPIIFK